MMAEFLAEHGFERLGRRRPRALVKIKAEPPDAIG